MAGIQIGELLVRQGVLNPSQVQRILEEQKSSHRPFGDLAERLYGVSAEAIEEAWIEQYRNEAGLVDLEELDVDIECLRTINRRQAWQFHMLPTHRRQRLLHVATDEQNLLRAMNFSVNRLLEPVNLLIAERSQLREFLMKHYPVPEHMAEFAESLV